MNPTIVELFMLLTAAAVTGLAKWIYSMQGRQTVTEGEVKELRSTRAVIIEDFRREQASDRAVIKTLSDKQDVTDKRWVNHNADFGKLISDLSHIYGMLKELKDDFRAFRADMNGKK